MTTITKRGDAQYQVEIRRKGYPRQSKTFETKIAAERWARHQEGAMDMGKFRDLRPLAKTTLGDALHRYKEEVTPSKALGGQRNERNRCDMLMRHALAERTMISLVAADFVNYRNQRLQEVGSANTVRLELALLSHLYTMAIKEWSWPLTHVLRDVRSPTPPDSRERRLSDEEEELLYKGTRTGGLRRSLWLEASIRLALETGMRPGEILKIQWNQVDLQSGVMMLTKTKNGSKRTVGLTLEAVKVLESLPRDQHRVIPVYPETGELDKDFKRACMAVGIDNLHFHDLRHEAASRLAPHMEVTQLAKIMGWKTLQMAMTYYNPTNAEIATTVREVEAKRAARKPGPELTPLAQPVVDFHPNVLHVDFSATATIRRLQPNIKVKDCSRFKLLTQLPRLKGKTSGYWCKTHDNHTQLCYSFT